MYQCGVREVDWGRPWIDRDTARVLNKPRDAFGEVGENRIATTAATIQSTGEHDSIRESPHPKGKK
jgi:hypothetical protein